VLICFKIRYVKDELSIIKELQWIAGFWIMCSFCYFLFFSLPNLYQSGKVNDAFQNYLEIGIFLAIQIRNYSTLLISTVFCLKVVRSPNLVYTAEDFTSLSTLLDFELVMISVIPYSYFKRYVNKFQLLSQTDSTVEG
jgi:hypothetical protein